MYILSSVCLRLGQFSQLSFIQYIGLYIFSLSISVMMIARIRVLPSFYHHQIGSIRCMTFYILTASLGQWFKCNSRKQIVFKREAYNWPFYWPVWGLLYINENVQFVGPSVLCPIVKQLLNNSVDRLNWTTIICDALWSLWVLYLYTRGSSVPLNAFACVSCSVWTIAKLNHAPLIFYSVVLLATI